MHYLNTFYCQLSSEHWHLQRFDNVLVQGRPVNRSLPIEFTQFKLLLHTHKSDTIQNQNASYFNFVLILQNANRYLFRYIFITDHVSGLTQLQKLKLTLKCSALSDLLCWSTMHGLFRVIRPWICPWEYKIIIYNDWTYEMQIVWN